MRFTLFFPALALLLFSCGNENSASSGNKLPENSDTVFGDTIPPPASLQLYRKEEFRREVDSIAAFASHWVGRNLDSTWKMIIDLTGDGKTDTALARITLLRNKPIDIIYTVRSSGKEIFRDTTHYSTDLEDYYQLEALDSNLYRNYKPYSAFFYACQLLPFAEQRDDIAGFADAPSTKSLFEEQQTAKNDAAFASFQSFLKSYKGGTLQFCDPLNCYGKIWFPQQNRFIDFYRP